MSQSHDDAKKKKKKSKGTRKAAVDVVETRVGDNIKLFQDGLLPLGPLPAWTPVPEQFGLHPRTIIPDEDDNEIDASFNGSWKGKAFKSIRLNPGDPKSDAAIINAFVAKGNGIRQIRRSRQSDADFETNATPLVLHGEEKVNRYAEAKLGHTNEPFIYKTRNGYQSRPASEFSNRDMAAAQDIAIPAHEEAVEVHRIDPDPARDKHLWIAPTGLAASGVTTKAVPSKAFSSRKKVEAFLKFPDHEDVMEPVLDSDLARARHAGLTTLNEPGWNHDNFSEFVCARLSGLYPTNCSPNLLTKIRTAMWHKQKQLADDGWIMTDYKPLQEPDGDEYPVNEDREDGEDEDNDAIREARGEAMERWFDEAMSTIEGFEGLDDLLQPKDQPSKYISVIRQMFTEYLEDEGEEATHSDSELELQSALKVLADLAPGALQRTREYRSTGDLTTNDLAST